MVKAFFRWLFPDLLFITGIILLLTFNDNYTLGIVALVITLIYLYIDSFTVFNDVTANRLFKFSRISLLPNNSTGDRIRGLVLIINLIKSLIIMLIILIFGWLIFIISIVKNKKAELNEQSEINS